MAQIVQDLPFYDEHRPIEIEGRQYDVLPRQLIVWVSLTPEGLGLDAGTPRFPVVLDPAFTDSFLIHQEQLEQFAGLQRAHLRRLSRTLRSSGRLIPVYLADVWLHRNVPGERDRFPDVAPFRLALHFGIGICTDPDLYPRLPLLGARAFRQNELLVTIDYKKCRVSIRTPRRFWFFG